MQAVSADRIDDAHGRRSPRCIRRQHHLGPGKDDDFNIRNMAETLNALASATSLMGGLLLCVAAISLVVGGVGIMNIMLVSVTERTREIGLRMAVGARSGNILRQFLVEAVLLCLLGGAIGIALGRSLLDPGPRCCSHWPIETSLPAILAAVAVSATVGMVFGWYPAWKASRHGPHRGPAVRVRQRGHQAENSSRPWAGEIRESRAGSGRLGGSVATIVRRPFAFPGVAFMTFEKPQSAQGTQRRTFLAQSLVGAAALAGVELSTETSEAAVEPPTAGSFRDNLLQCLGGPWPEPCDLKPMLRETIRKDGYRIESVTYEAEPGDRVPAYVLIPDGVDAAHPAPAVAVWHQHNGAWHLGKVEPAGLAGTPMHHTGVALAKEGYVVICPDALCFGERQSPHLQGGDYERFEFLRYVVAGKCMAWKNILDMRRAIDYLSSRPEVKPDRIGCYGHSMGSTFTWLVGPWEPRLKCLVGNCCLPTYAAIQRTHLLHCFPNFIPGLYQLRRHARHRRPDRPPGAAPEPGRDRRRQPDRGSPRRGETDRRGVPGGRRSRPSSATSSKPAPATCSPTRCGAVPGVAPQTLAGLRSQ